MNTNDIRNMESKQWVYWATALPLTITIVLLCLAWAGQLQRYWNPFRKLLSGGRDAHSNHWQIPETFPNIDPRYGYPGYIQPSRRRSGADPGAPPIIISNSSSTQRHRRPSIYI